MADAKYRVKVGDAEYVVTAPDADTAWQWANMTHAQAAPAQPALTPAPVAPAAQPSDENFLTSAVKRNVPLFKQGLAQLVEDAPAVLGSIASAFSPGNPITGQVMRDVGRMAAASDTYKGLTGDAVKEYRAEAEQRLAELGPGKYGSVFEEQGFGRKLGSLAETVAESALPVGAGLLTGLVTRSPIAAGAVMGIGNVPMTYGGIRDRQKAEGIDDVNRAVFGTAVSSALDILTGVGGKVLSGTSAIAAREILEGGLKQAAIRIAKSGGEEGVTEMLQNVVEQVAGGTNPATKQAIMETLEAGLAGAFGGTVFTGASEAVTAPFRSKAEQPSGRVADPAAVRSEFERLASEEVAAVMADNPGMDQKAAVNAVAARAEELYATAAANVATAAEEAANVAPDVDTGLDVSEGSGAGIAPDLGAAPTATGAPVAGETVAGGLVEPVPSVPVPDVGAGEGVGALAPITAKQVKATVPTIEQTFADNQIDFEETFGIKKLNAEQKKQAARIVLQSPEVDPYDAIGSVLERGQRLRGEQLPMGERPGTQRTVTDINGVTSVEEGPTTPAPKRLTIDDILADVQEQAPTTAVDEELAARDQEVSQDLLAPEVQTEPTVADTATVEKVTPGVPVPFESKGGNGTATFNLRDDGRLERTVTYDDGTTERSFLMEEANGDQMWDTGTSIRNNEPVLFGSEAQAMDAAKDNIPGTPAPTPTSITTQPKYTPQEIADHLDSFSFDAARDLGLDPSMFTEGVRDIQRGAEPFTDEQLLASSGPEKLKAYKAGMQWAKDRIADATQPATAPKPAEAVTYDSVLREATQRHADGKITDAGLALVKERVGYGLEAQQSGEETRYTPEEVTAALDRVTAQDSGVDISTEGNPEAEAEYMTDAAHEAAQTILSDFMVGDQVTVGNSPGVVVGLDGDYVRVRPDSARHPKAYNRVPKSSVQFVARPDNATTVSASKVEGQDAKFGEEAGQLNADMAGLIQLMGANMYAANVADVSVKELLQNAFDAVKGAVSGKRAAPLYKDGKIEITLNRDDRTITIKDNARGMTPDIVREAFFTVAGSDKSDLDPQERSGGLGLAKMGFMMGATWLKLDTVRDGVRVTVDATSKEIAGSDFKIVKSPAPAGEHGTTVTVKIPETYIDPKTGDAKDIWFPYSKDSVGILNKPLIGPAEVVFTYEGGYGSDAPEVLPLGTNFPYDNYQKLEAKFDWGTADIYYGKKRVKYPSHQVLSSGVYQFDTSFNLSQNEKIPYDLIINIKSDVEAKHPDYPFENSRERFKGRLKADINSLTLYLAKIARGAEAADLKDTMQNVVSLPRVEAGEDLKALEGKLKKSFEQTEGPAKELPQLPTQVTINDTGVFDNGGKTVVDTTKEAEKNKESTFEAAKAAPTQDDFMIELSQDPRNPIFHNNTSFDPIAVGTPYGEPGKFFAELGSLFVEMKEALAASGRYRYDQLSPDNFFYAGIGIDKQYGGLHAKVPYKAILLNPFYDWGARTLNGIRGNMMNTMIHELAHTGDMDHGVGHNNEIIKVEQYLYDEGLYDYFRDAIMDLLLRHESTYTAMRDAYGQSTTQNIAKSLEDYAKEGSASASSGRDQNGAGDASEAVPAGGRQGGGSDLSASASASSEGPDRGGTGRGGEPVTDANVDKVVSAKLTKGQLKRLEQAAGAERMKLSNMQKRIARSRSAEETMSLAGKLALMSRNPDADVNLLTSLYNSVPPTVLQKLLGPMMTEDVVRLAERAGMENISRIDDMMRNEYIPYVNRLMQRASKVADKWADFTSRTELGSQALADTMYIANMYDVDPTLAPTATDYAAVDTKLNDLQLKLAGERDAAKRNAIKGQISRRRGEIQRVYYGGQDEDGTVVYGWNDLSRSDFGSGEGKKLFRMARDEYRANFEEHYRLLMQRIDESQFENEKAIELKGAIDRMFDKARERTIYFPLKRFGDYWVSVGKGPNSEFHMFESASDQDAFLAKLREEGETRAIDFSQGKDTLRQGLRKNASDASVALKNLFDLIEGGTVSDMELLKDNIFQMYLMALPEADMRRRFIHREFKTGFSTDALRTFAATAVASANQLGRLAYNYKFKNLIDQSYAETAGNPSKRRLDVLTREIEMRVNNMMSPDPEDGLDLLISYGAKATFLFLLSAPKTAFMNFTQLHIVGLPTLSAEFGEAATVEMATRYTAELLTGKRVANPFRDEEGNVRLQMPNITAEDSSYIQSLKETDPDRYAAIKKAWEYGKDRDITESTFSSAANVYERSNEPTGKHNFTQAMRRGDVVTAAQRGAGNAIDAMGSLFHGTERIGREVMYMSAFEMAYERNLKQGMDPVKAGDMAMEQAAKLTNAAMFDFSNWNKSRYAKAPAGRLALQMRSYSFAMSSLLLRSFVNMIALQRTGAERKAAARVFFGVGAMTALYGGFRATQFSALAMMGYGLYEFVKDAFGGDDDREEKEVAGGYIDPATMQEEMLKYADDKGRELSKKDMEYYIRSTWIPETFGPGGTLQSALGISDSAAKKLEAAADVGLPGAFGVDISNSVSLADLWHPVTTKADDMDVRVFEALGRIMLGPTGTLLAAPAKAAKEANAGNIDKAIEAGMPALIKNYVKMQRLKEEGLVVGKDRDVVLKDPSFYDSYMLGMQSLGFAEQETSRAMQLDIAATGIEKEIAAQATDLLSQRYRAARKYYLNPTPETQRDFQRVERAIEIYNMNYPSNAIDEETKAKSYQNKSKDAAERAGGLGYNPKIPIRQTQAERRAYEAGQ